MKEAVEFTVEPMQPPALPGLTMAFFKDVDGNIVQLLENWDGGKAKSHGGRS